MLSENWYEDGDEHEEQFEKHGGQFEDYGADKHMDHAWLESVRIISDRGCQVRGRKFATKFISSWKRKTHVSADRRFSGIDCEQMETNLENLPNGFFQNDPI